jgi:predicted glycoside hydrolase/deacetylase ChbG (UPF0249 family)
MTAIASGTSLVVNGDDFGRSPGLTRGILECLDHGILTSASLMAVWPASPAAAEAARARPRLSVGLHVDLGEWIHRDDAWHCTYLRVALEDEQAVRDEVGRQLRVFRRLLDRDPTHLDSHQHVHLNEPAKSVLVELAGSLGIPLRHEAPGIRYCGDFFGQTNRGEGRPGALSVDAMIGILRALTPGVTELCCHPGYADDLSTGYRGERQMEIRTLCDPRVRATVDDLGIELRSFAVPGDVHAQKPLQSSAV